MNIPLSTIEPFGYTGMPFIGILEQDDPNDIIGHKLKKYYIMNALPILASDKPRINRLSKAQFIMESFAKALGASSASTAIYKETDHSWLLLEYAHQGKTKTIRYFVD